MAILDSLVMRGAKKTIGGITIRVIGGQTVASATPTVVANPRTARQVENRGKFSEVSKYAAAIRQFLKANYTPSLQKWSAGNQFTREFMNATPAGDISPTQAASTVVAYTRGVLTMGNISNASAPVSTNQGTGIELDLAWSSTPQGQDAGQDELFVLVANVTNGTYTVEATGVARASASHLTVINGLNDEDAFVFVPFFKSNATGKVATAYPAAYMSGGAPFPLYGAGSGPFGG